MPTVSLSTIQQMVLDRVEGNNGFYPTAQITGAINECYRIANIFCGINQALVSIPGFSVANKVLYSIPSPILFPIRVSFEGVQLDRLSLGALARSHPSWATSTTAKSGPVQRWAPIGITQFVIHPADALGGRDIAVMGVTEVTPLANAGDVISVEDDFITMIVEYAAHRIQLKEGGAVFSDSSLFLNTFHQKLQERQMFTQVKFPRYPAAIGPRL